MPLNRTPIDLEDTLNDTDQGTSQQTENRTNMNQNTNQNTDQTATPSGEIHRVSIKPVQFIKTAPELYFLQMEAQFSLANITRDHTKYNHVLGTLDPTYLTSVMDIIRDPPANNKYLAIKNRIIAEFQQSDQHKLRILLREIELGDLKPSQLLRKMRELSKNALSDDALKTLWIERLPEQIRPVISISGEDLNKIAVMADKMLEITTYNFVNEVAAPVTLNHTDLQIAALAKQVEELTKTFSQFSHNRGRSQSRGSSNNRRRSSSKPKNDSPYCYYHYRFGAMAQKCTDPCQFKTEKSKRSDGNSKN